MATELANAGLALRTHLRASTLLVTAPYVGSTQNIVLGWPKDKINPTVVPPYKAFIVILVGRGGPGDIGLGRQQERMDIMCYGTSDTHCKEIWRAMDNYLIPRFERRKSSFTQNGCQINSIVREGGPLTLTDSDAADWPYTMAGYIIDFNGEPRV